MKNIQEDRYSELFPINNSRNFSSHLLEKIKANLIEIEPEKCFRWEFHNRSMSWLNKKNCQDLISSIQQIGQVEPILVRQVRGDPNYDYEIIFGLRRWFACSQIPNQKVLAYVTEADDKICAILMHAENANRQDITDFERACSFAQQMTRGLFKNQNELAEAMGVSQGFISKMLTAAELCNYEWLHSLLKQKLDIPIKYAYILARLLKNPEVYELIKRKSEVLKTDHEKIGVFPPTARLGCFVMTGEDLT